MDADSNNAKTPRFENQFWGVDDKGLEVIREWLHRVHESNVEFLGLISLRIAIEDEYGQKIMKSFKPSIGRHEIGSIKASFDATRNSIEKTGKQHVQLGADLKEQVEKPLTEFINTQESQRKIHKDNMKKALKKRQDLTFLVQKAREKYEKLCRELDATSHVAGAPSGKDLEKHESKIRKATQQVHEAEGEYQLLVTKAREAYDQWSTAMKENLQQLQTLEEIRINQFKVFLKLTSNLLGTLYTAGNESLDAVNQSLELCDATSDIKKFITIYATGESKPPIPTFINYYKDPSADGKIENFENASSNNAHPLSTRQFASTPEKVLSSATATANAMFGGVTNAFKWSTSVASNAAATAVTAVGATTLFNANSPSLSNGPKYGQLAAGESEGNIVSAASGPTPVAAGNEDDFGDFQSA